MCGRPETEERSAKNCLLRSVSQSEKNSSGGSRLRTRGYMYATLNAPLLKPVQGVGEMNVAGVRISENEANFIPFGCEFDAS